MLMQQLDVDVSPPAFIWNPHLTMTLVTFDLDPVTSTLLVNISTSDPDLNPHDLDWVHACTKFHDSSYRPFGVKCAPCFCHFLRLKWCSTRLSFSALVRNIFSLLNQNLVYIIVWLSGSNFRAKTIFLEGLKSAKKMTKLSQFHPFPIQQHRNVKKPISTDS